MKKILLGLLLLAGFQVFAQSDYEVITEKKTKTVIYKGECNFGDLLKEPSFAWLKSGAEAYSVDSATRVYLASNLKNYKLVVFMGTWCDDTYNILPKLYKTLQVTNFPMSQYTMYAVDRNKATKNIEHKLYRVQNVPTIIVFKGSIEIGRITEAIKKSVEKDIATIIRDNLNKDEMMKEMKGN